MTDGTSQGLFIVVAIVIFGIFTLMAYILFEDTLSPALAGMFTEATEQSQMKLRYSKEIVNIVDFTGYSTSNIPFKPVNGTSASIDSDTGDMYNGQSTLRVGFYDPTNEGLATYELKIPMEYLQELKVGDMVTIKLIGRMNHSTHLEAQKYGDLHFNLIGGLDSETVTIEKGGDWIEHAITLKVTENTLEDSAIQISMTNESSTYWFANLNVTLRYR